MPNCIYCNKVIPKDIGVSCSTCNPKSSTKNYDKELQYDQDVAHLREDKIPDLMQSIAEGATHKQTGSQAKEEFYRLFEQNVDSRKQFRWTQQEEFKQRRVGKILHMNEFLRLLRKAGLDSWYTSKGGMRGTLGLYVLHTGMFSKCQHERDVPHYVGFVQVPFMQEYEELHFDRYDVPLGSKRRGWRTVLLKLVEQKLISEERAHEVFGDPSDGFISRRYKEYMHFLRHAA